MPGPGHKKTKAKANKTLIVSKDVRVNDHNARNASRDVNMDSSTALLVDDVNKAEEWKLCSDILCKFLEIPDLSSRNGLKQIHKNFDDYYQRLDGLFRAYGDSDKVAGGIVGIYAKMCADSLLRDKLFKDAHILPNIITLLGRPECLHVALQALCSITHHGGRDIRVEIAKETSVLIRLLEEHTKDPVVSRLIVVILSHTTSAVVASDTPPGPNQLKSVNMPKLIRVMVSQLRRPDASSELIDHALTFLSGATQNCSDVFFAYPTAIDLLVACSRSQDLQIRAMGVSGIMRLYISNQEKDDLQVDPMKIMEVMAKRMPDHLTDAIMERNSFGEMFLTLSASQNFQNAMVRVVKDRDLYQLGLSIAKLIMTTEFSVPNGGFETQNPRTGKREVQDLGLPFKQFHDALPLCARAIRKKGIKDEEDLADILDLKFLIMKSRMEEAYVIAKGSINRNPRIGFYYYVLTLGAPEEIGLRWAKKGLMCPNLTDYVRNALHYRAAEHAIHLGTMMLTESGKDVEDWDEGIAFLMSALEDTKAFIDQAAPDCRSMKSVICLYTLVSFVLKGHEYGTDLKGLKDAIDLLKIADELTVYFGRRVAKTQLRLARDTLVSRTPAAAKEWDEHVTRFCTRSTSPANDIVVEKAEMDLAAWLDTMHLEDGKPIRLTHGHENKPRPTVNPSRVALYRCSWCKNPSAALKKCSACEMERYCDAPCQKEHWKSGHKKVCRSSSSIGKA